MKSSSMAKILSFTIAVLLAAAASGCQYILPKEEEPLAPPLVQPKDVVYTTVDVARGDMQQTVQGVGRFESVKMVDLSYSESGGRLKSLNVKVGDDVKKGDIIAQLDTADLDYKLQVEKLRLKQMENNYASLKKAMKRAKDQTPVTNAAIDLQIERLTVQQLENQKSDSILRSPIDGSVVYVAVTNLGDAVDAYSTLARIADVGVKMLTYIKDSGNTQFQIGMKVKVTLRSDSSTMEGEVVSTPDDMVQKDKTKTDNTVYIKLSDDFMKKVDIGEEASIVMVVAERQNVLKLPRNVVRTYMLRRYVQALVDGVKVEKDVQVGLETTTECEIISGLNEGDKVIIS
jgi:membrane fusion protein, macrolide-specific efflux system